MKNFNLIQTNSKAKNKVPFCIHGPNLLLEDLNENIPEYKRKYVCSANRKNECKPFPNFDLKRFKKNHLLKRQNYQQRLLETLKSDEKDRKWCVDCSVFLLKDELENHEDHYVKENLTKKQLKEPTKLLSANIEKTEEAQYFFSKQSLQVILKTVIKEKFTDVLCIGCPSVHEKLNLNSKKFQINSYLLDIDTRYLQFYTKKNFLCFNMANNYFFDDTKYEKYLDDFITNSKKLLIIVDPPFGIMIPALANTLTKLKKKVTYLKKEDESFSSNLILFHLYFYEKRIISQFPELKMMDFQVTYSNHKKMKEDETSIARMFTDIEGDKIVLKGFENYKFCEQCNRWVHKIAEHCVDCKNCCSKDGKPSVHCAVCDKCVKITWDHCFKCELCTLKGKCKCSLNNENEETNSLMGEEDNYDEEMNDYEFSFGNKRKSNEFKTSQSDELEEDDLENDKDSTNDDSKLQNKSFDNNENSYQKNNFRENKFGFKKNDNFRDRKFAFKENGNFKDRKFGSRENGDFKNRKFGFREKGDFKDRKFGFRNNGDFKDKKFGFRENGDFKDKKFGFKRNDSFQNRSFDSNRSFPSRKNKTRSNFDEIFGKFNLDEFKEEKRGFRNKNFNDSYGRKNFDQNSYKRRNFNDDGDFNNKKFKNFNNDFKDRNGYKNNFNGDFKNKFKKNSDFKIKNVFENQKFENHSNQEKPNKVIRFDE